MKNSMLYVGVIVVGVIALIIGVLYLANVFGDHPTRAYVALGAGVVLVIIGIGGMMMSRSASSSGSTRNTARTCPPRARSCTGGRANKEGKMPSPSITIVVELST